MAKNVVAIVAVFLAAIGGFAIGARQTGSASDDGYRDKLVTMTSRRGNLAMAMRDALASATHEESKQILNEALVADTIASGSPSYTD
jgi:hypothetical protein